MARGEDDALNQWTVQRTRYSEERQLTPSQPCGVGFFFACPVRFLLCMPCEAPLGPGPWRKGADSLPVWGAVVAVTGQSLDR